MNIYLKQNPAPKITIILLNYNGWQDTLDCLDSLDSIKQPHCSTIVVDNASPMRPRDMETEVIRRAGHFIQAPCNGGFAYGNNFGIRWALDQGANYILLLNNDTEVKPDFLGKMLERMEQKPDVGVLGSRILYYDEPDKVWFNGARINWWKGTGVHYDVGKLSSEVDYREANEYITGCVLLVRAKVFKTVGLLDESYFMYFEDVVFSQAVIRAGYCIDYAPDAVVYHKVGASGGGRSENFVTVYYGNQSRIRFLNSEFYDSKPLERCVAKSFFYLTRVVKAMKYAVTGKTELLMALKRSLTQREL